MIQRPDTVRSVQVEWVGYKVHLTETCDEGLPHLRVNVETTPGTTPDLFICLLSSMRRWSRAGCCPQST